MEKPVVEDMEVTQELFEVAYVFNTIEDLKDNGLLEGGYYVDRGVMKAIEAAGREYGYVTPSKERIEEILAEIVMSQFDGDDDETEAEVSN